MNPKVSIIIPCYNVSDYIAETLDSVFAQTFTDYEVIIINDGSPDTPEFEKKIEKYVDRILYLKQENKGVGPARNLGIQNSEGEFLAFLDGDDVWFPDYLHEQIKFIETSDSDLVYADALYFGEVFTNAKTFMQDAPSNGEANFESLLSCDCNIILSGSIAKKKAVLAAGMFEPTDVRAQDYVLWLRMTHRGSKVSYQRKVLLKYRVRRNSISGDSVQRIKREIDAYHRIANLVKLSKSQENIINSRLERLNIDLEVERGKVFLLKEDFENARKSFKKANEYRHSNRLSWIILMLGFAPKFFLRIYQKIRAKEIEFVPTDVK